MLGRGHRVARELTGLFFGLDQARTETAEAPVDRPWMKSSGQIKQNQIPTLASISKTANHNLILISKS